MKACSCERTLDRPFLL